MVESSCHFSPGDECRNKIIDLIVQARRSVWICVFTISDDRITEAILAAHARGLDVRVLSDDDKSEDRGSDIDHLIASGVPVRLDQSSHHMHHKFALFDQQILLNGSFNWTRSASYANEENILVTGEPRLVSGFTEQFETLWDSFC